MNCLDFRRLMLADPRHLSDGQRAHMAGCRACQEYAARSGEFETVLEGALRVPVPDGLAERILLQRRMAHAHQRFGWVALAVSLFLGVAATTLWFRGLEPRDTAHAVIAHVVSEPGALRDRQRVSADAVREAFALVGAQVREPLPGVRHLAPCEVEGKPGRHMVLHTDQGLVTVIVMPEHERVPWRMVTTEDGYTTAVVPAQRGNLGIVVDAGRDVAQVERLLRAHVSWSG